IYRKDPCEFCLCLDGEMFCWWQDCPPAAEGPCKDRGPFTPCQIKSAVSKPMPPKVETAKPTTKSSESIASTLLLSTQSSKRLEAVVPAVSSTEMAQTDERASSQEPTAKTTMMNGNTPNPMDGTTDVIIATDDAPKICTVM
ncbi:PREDICTED: uncharacterized protein LOC108564186, partial [Nicrophorus vespilloides]|uniref:Uncharacterized protein LOC108564186 n=1 Tax=Nicrophorus vespilloides TaxID=110193 RepID=A0ABM1MVM8_NICVS